MTFFESLAYPPTITGDATITWSGTVNTNDIGTPFFLTTTSFDPDSSKPQSNVLSPIYEIDPSITPEAGGNFYFTLPTFTVLAPIRGMCCPIR